MPKIPQVVVPEGNGRAKRLMVRAKKGSKRGVFLLTENVYDLSVYNECNERFGKWVTVTKKITVDGCLRGTKVVPVSNAMKHPQTNLPQIAEVLVQLGTMIASLPPSEAEFYWQKGKLGAGRRFTPDKEPKVKPAPDPA